jgi:biopolymer transport protein ExbB
MLKISDILGHMGLPAIAVASTLVLMALASLAVFFERLWALSRSRAASRVFAAKARSLIAGEQHDELVKQADAAPTSHLARLLGAGAKAWLEAVSKPRRALSPVEATRRELTRQSDALAADVRRGMGVLASVGSIAPFVGLLGTVFGIITSFQGIAKEGSGGLGAVSMGISEALYETALGLVVAIPAVLMSTGCRRRVTPSCSRWTTRAASTSTPSRTPRPCRGRPMGADLGTAGGVSARGRRQARDQHHAAGRRGAGAVDHLHGGHPTDGGRRVSRAAVDHHAR